MLEYLSADISCSEKRTVLTVSYEEQINFNFAVQGNVQGNVHIFAPNGGYCVYYSLNRFRNARCFENRGIFNNYSTSARWI